VIATGTHCAKRPVQDGGAQAAVARAFALSGAHVTATGVAQREIDALAGDADFAGAEPVLLDVRDAAAIGELVGKLPALDILLNCAGMIRRGEELDPAVFEQVLDVNLNGTMRMCLAARQRLSLVACGK
jgi:NAD(P)-dependent dehydrogenase (short-subunit alcohol dehydrogenase family)